MRKTILFFCRVFSNPIAVCQLILENLSNGTGHTLDRKCQIATFYYANFVLFTFHFEFISFWSIYSECGCERVVNLFQSELGSNREKQKMFLESISPINKFHVPRLHFPSHLLLSTCAVRMLDV